MERRRTERAGRMLRTLLLGLVMAGATGCIVVDHGHEHLEPTDLTLLWDFEGLDCVRAGVSRTAVELYEHGGLVIAQEVPCDASGVTFRDFPTGRFDYRLFGISPSGRVLYDGAGAVSVFRGDNVFNLRLWFAR